MGESKKQQDKKIQGMHYSFILFVVENGDNSGRALENLKRLCQKWLPDQYSITVVDVVEDFQTALDYNVLVTPSVIVKEPEPRVLIHGDLSDPRKFIDALNLDKSEENGE